MVWLPAAIKCIFTIVQHLQWTSPASQRRVPPIGVMKLTACAGANDSTFVRCCPLAMSCDKRSPLPALKCHLRVTAVKCLLSVKWPRKYFFVAFLFSTSSLFFFFFLARMRECLGVAVPDGSHNCQQRRSPFWYYLLGKHTHTHTHTTQTNKGHTSPLGCPQVAL